MKDELSQEPSDTQEFVMWTRVTAISDCRLQHESTVPVCNFRKVQDFTLFVHDTLFVLLKS